MLYEEKKGESKRKTRWIRVFQIIVTIAVILLAAAFMMMVFFPASSWGGGQGWLEFFQ